MEKEARVVFENAQHAAKLLWLTIRQSQQLRS